MNEVLDVYSVFVLSCFSGALGKTLWTVPQDFAKKNMLMKHHSFQAPETFYLSDASLSLSREKHSGEISLCAAKGFRTSCAFMLSFNDSVEPLMLQPH